LSLYMCTSFDLPLHFLNDINDRPLFTIALLASAKVRTVNTNAMTKDTFPTTVTNGTVNIMRPPLDTLWLENIQFLLGFSVFDNCAISCERKFPQPTLIAKINCVRCGPRPYFEYKVIKTGMYFNICQWRTFVRNQSEALKTGSSTDVTDVRLWGTNQKHALVLDVKRTRLN
jgi:hypothetical protein